ncbi:Chaperone protein DnaK, partial [hydrothermal vent metagenome]
FDQHIIDWAAEQFKMDQGIDLREDRQALQRLREAAEKAKIELSTTTQSELNLPYITADASGPKHLTLTLSRAKFDQLTGDLVKRSIEPCRQALKDADVAKGDITQVVLVGGMTRVPAIQEAVRQFFGREPHKGVNPDEVVGIGAAIQAGVLGGDVKDVLLLDVTPLTLSIETLGGVATALIERNTTIPTKKSQVFSTASDSQSQVEIHVTQGERQMAADNKGLGKFILDGIPPAPRGIPQIEVTFDINADGILNVTAADKATGKQQAMQIISSSGLADSEIEKMVQDAETHAAEDEERRKHIEAHNKADSAVYSAEKFLTENGEQIPEASKAGIQSQIDAVKEVLQGEGDAASLETAVSNLQNVLNEAGAAMYQQQEQQQEQQQGQPTSGDPSANGDADNEATDSDEDVIEGEFSDA